MNKLLIAMVAHEINRAYCASLGDTSQATWAEAPEWQQKSAVAGVEMHLNNPDATPEQSHQLWFDGKAKDGWKFGKEKDADKKLHPCMVPYDELPQEQKSKDYLLKATVHAVKHASDEMAKAIEAEIKSQVASARPHQPYTEADSDLTPVRYIGRPEEWVERRYKSGLTFAKNQVRNLPGELAQKLLRHSDLFEMADQSEALDDDTAEALGRSKTENDEANKIHEESQAMREEVLNMDKEALEHFAYTRYQQKINKRRSVENLREEVIGFVDQYGVV